MSFLMSNCNLKVATVVAVDMEGIVADHLEVHRFRKFLNCSMYNFLPKFIILFIVIADVTDLGRIKRKILVFSFFTVSYRVTSIKLDFQFNLKMYFTQ